ncbi:MAG: amidohydrolase family protein, partial [Chloroflexota bacterium]
MSAVADIIYRNGAIYTVDTKRTWASAVAIRNGKFIYVGDNTGSQSFIGPETEIIDLNGRMAMPGLHDMHIHGVEGAKSHLFHCQFPMTATVDDIAATVANFAANKPDEACIVGGAWYMTLADKLDKATLDTACPDRPVFLWDSSHHNAWVNSKLLEMAGITEDTPDPEGGTFVKNADGQLTGLLLETASAVAAKVIPDRTQAEYGRAIEWLGTMLNGYGVT